MANKRMVTLGAGFAVAGAVLAGRVFQIQVLQAEHYRGLAQSQSLRRDVLAPKRGEIFDRAGTRLVVNVEPGGAPRKGAGEAFRWSRLCPNGSLAGQVLGVVGRDGYGQSGLEFHLDRDLRGTDGWRYVRHDARNRYAPGVEDRQRPPVDGLGVRLALDAQVQAIAELALERGVRRAGAKQGVAIVVEPATGDVLAMANFPFFNPNTRERRDGANWRNHALGKIYEPGSTFKAITAAALLEEGLAAPSDTVDAEGGTYKIAGELIRDTHPLDRVSFTDAMAHSSNIVFAKLSLRLTPTSFYRYIRSFGFGMKTGMPLPAEESGWVLPVSRWSGRSQPTLAFGHELAATPLQVAMAFAAIANGGVLMRPRLVRAWVDPEGGLVREEPTRMVRRVLSEATAASLRGMLRKVVDSGTARDIRHPAISIAGKTGTAEKLDSTGKYVKGKFNASFVGMAPAEAPAMVCLVLLDEPEQLKYGGQSAAPIFREILDRLAVAWGWPLGEPLLASAPAGLKAPSRSQPIPERAPERAAAKGAAQPAAAAPDPAQGENGLAAEGAMPDLHNATLRDALQRLRQLGLDVEYSGEGKVIRQHPAPGTPLRRGQSCRLTLGWMG